MAGARDGAEERLALDATTAPRAAGGNGTTAGSWIPSSVAAQAYVVVALDTAAPVLAGPAPSVGTTTGGQLGPAGFTLTLDFSEPMDTGTDPAVTLPATVEDPPGTLTAAGGVWAPIDVHAAASSTVAEGVNGATTGMAVAEETIATTSGASVTSTVVIPNRAICLGVSVRVTSAIVGPTSFDVGIAGEADKFGGALGISAGSVNRGVIGPTAFYADTPVLITANGADFAGGEVRLAIHTITVGASEAGS